VFTSGWFFLKNDFLKKKKKPNNQKDKKIKDSVNDDVVKACIEFTTPNLVLKTSIITAATKLTAERKLVNCCDSTCKKTIKNKKLTSPKISTKSQPHQPFQFSSCCAHQPPKISATKESKLIFFLNLNNR